MTFGKHSSEGVTRAVSVFAKKIKSGSFSKHHIALGLFLDCHPFLRSHPSPNCSLLSFKAAFFKLVASHICCVGSELAIVFGVVGYIFCILGGRHTGFLKHVNA